MSRFFAWGRQRKNEEFRQREIFMMMIGFLRRAAACAVACSLICPQGYAASANMPPVQATLDDVTVADDTVAILKGMHAKGAKGVPPSSRLADGDWGEWLHDEENRLRRNHGQKMWGLASSMSVPSAS